MSVLNPGFLSESSGNLMPKFSLQIKWISGWKIQESAVLKSFPGNLDMQPGLGTTGQDWDRQEIAKGDKELCLRDCNSWAESQRRKISLCSCLDTAIIQRHQRICWVCHGGGNDEFNLCLKAENQNLHTTKHNLDQTTWWMHNTFSCVLESSINNSQTRNPPKEPQGLKGL